MVPIASEPSRRRPSSSTQLLKLNRKEGQANLSPRPAGDAAFPGCEYESDEIEFMLAMDAYKRINRRPFPTWAEVLGVLMDLGYRKGKQDAECTTIPREEEQAAEQVSPSV